MVTHSLYQFNLTYYIICYILDIIRYLLDFIRYMLDILTYYTLSQLCYICCARLNIFILQTNF